MAETLDTAPASAPVQEGERGAPRFANAVTIAGTLERDPQILVNESTGKERAVVRIKETSPGYSFEKDGATITVPDKDRYRSATIVGQQAVDAVRNLEQGDELTVRGRLETFQDPDTKRQRIAIRAFEAEPGISDDLRAEPNQVQLAGTITTDPQLRLNPANPNLNSLNYTLETFGKNSEALAIREFGADVAQLEPARQNGTELELDGRFTEAVFQGRNGQVRTYSISTTPDEVREIVRSQQREPEPNVQDLGLASPVGGAFASVPSPTNEPILNREGGGFTELFDRGLRGELNVPPPGSGKLDISRLPIFEPPVGAVVEQRENFRLDFEQRFEVLGRNSASDRVFGRNGGAILSTSSDAFEKAPVPGDVLDIKADSTGKDIAKSVTRDIGLEV